METVGKTKQTILKAITSDDSEARDLYLQHFGKNVEIFCAAMAKAFVNWRVMNDQVKTDDRLGHVSALVFTAMTLNILSMKLYISGLQVASGNLFRQVVETMSLALLCSGKDLDVLSRFIDQKYSTNDAVRDVNRHAEKLGLNKVALVALSQAQKFYHNYSHPSMLTIATGVSFSQQGGLNRKPEGQVLQSRMKIATSLPVAGRDKAARGLSGCEVMTPVLQQSRVYIWSVVWLLCLVLVARASAAQGEDDLTAPIRIRAEALLEILRADQWDKVAPFVIVSTGRDDTATRRRMEIPMDANPELIHEKVGRWFKRLYGSVKPGGIINVQLKGADDAFIIYRHDDIDGFYMHRVGGEWYYTLDE